jgi:hypothetical protein
MHISLPLVVGGLPEGAQVMPDYLSVSFEWPDLTWSPARRLGANARLSSQGEVVLDTPVSMDVSLFNAKSKTPLTIRGTVYLTLFGEPERRSLPLRRGPANAQDGLQCYAQELEFHRDYIQCRSMFRWPSRLVRAEAHGGIIDIGT